MPSEVVQALLWRVVREPDQQHGVGSEGEAMTVCPKSIYRPNITHGVADGPHVCPFAEAIEDYAATLCACCSICTAECATDANAE